MTPEEYFRTRQPQSFLERLKQASLQQPEPPRPTPQLTVPSQPPSPPSELMSKVTRGVGTEGKAAGGPVGHHRFWDRLKSIGQGALMGVGQGGLGGGIAGAVIGGVSPQRIDLARYRQQQSRAQTDEYRNLEIEKQRAEVERLRRGPTPQKPTLHNVSPDEDVITIGPDGQPQVVYHAPSRAAKAEKPDEFTLGNQRVRIGLDGKPQVVYEAPAKAKGEGGLTPYQQAQIGERRGKRQSERAAAQNEVQSLIAEEEAARVKKDAAYQTVHQLTVNNAPPEDIDAAQKQADAAQKHYAGFADKKRVAQAKLDAKGGGERTKSLDPALEKRIRAAATAKGLDPDTAVQRALSRQ